MQEFVSNEITEQAAVQITPAERNKRRYWERRNNHLCVVCGKANEDGKAYCPECRAKDNERKKQDRLFYKELGFCSRCGRYRVFGDDKTCPECRARDYMAKGRTDVGKKKKRDHESFQRRYRERSEQGICVACGRRRAAGGRKRCIICCRKDAAVHMEKYRIEHAADIPKKDRPLHGLCYTCGGKLDMDNTKLCSRCYENIVKTTGRKNKYWESDNEIVFRKKGDSCDVATESARKIFQASPYANAFVYK